jgi:hypothetical protein
MTSDESSNVVAMPITFDCDVTTNWCYRSMFLSSEIKISWQKFNCFFLVRVKSLTALKKIVN